MVPPPPPEPPEPDRRPPAGDETTGECGRIPPEDPVSLGAPGATAGGKRGPIPSLPGEGGPAGAAGRSGKEADPIERLLAQLDHASGPADGGGGGGPSAAGDASFTIEREIGRGGMGRVFLAFDRNIRRRIAVKVIQNHLRSHPEHLARFIEEAQITGQLEHPGIPPIHELGVNRDREVFFSMKLVRGRTLKDIIRDLHIGRRDVRERYSLKRLLGILQAVCNAVHFAHEKGVIHRDLKPENIMVGDYGEVQLMDWGLAKVIGAPEPSRAAAEDPVETLRTDTGLVSAQGFVQGTLHYMSPEQAQGRNELIDARSDVYSLGATLYEILTFHPPVSGESVRDLLEESRLNLITPPRERAPKMKIPPALEEICMKALEYHPDDRYQTAQEMAEDIQVFIDGTREEERRKAEAERLLLEARKVLREHDREKREVEALRREARELGRAAPRAHPRPEDRRRERELQAAMAKQSIAAATLYTRAQTLLSSALGSDPENGAVRRLLADLYLERFLQADREGNQTDLIFYRGLIEQVNDGALDRVLQGDGSLAIETTPGGAAMTLLRYREEEGVLRAAEEVWRGPGPLSLQEVPMGSYLLLIEREGSAPTRHPVLVSRNQEVRAMVKLYPREAIPPGFAYIPEGPFICHGDPRVPSVEPEPHLQTLPGFAIGIHPVTCGEYREFLDDLLASDPEQARRRGPRESEHSGHYWRVEPDGKAGKLVYPAGGRYAFGDRLPVFGVSFEDAIAYCRWRSARDGLRYDLPTELEWEKAARGVDGRFFAWGNQFESGFCNNYQASETRHGVASVDEFPEDVSPYGVRGMTGNVGDLCHDSFDTRPGVAGLRGGNWALTEHACRLATRRQLTSTYVSDRIGFRLKLVLWRGIPLGGNAEGSSGGPGGRR